MEINPKEFDSEKEQTPEEIAARNNATEEALGQALERRGISQGESLEMASRAQKEGVLRRRGQKTEITAAGGAEKLLAKEKAAKRFAEIIQDVLMASPTLQIEDMESVLKTAMEQVKALEKRMGMGG